MPQPFFLTQPPPPPPPPPNLQSNSLDLNNRVNPSILLVIIIIAIIFFVSGLLHLLVRFLLRPTQRDPDDSDNVTALQGQLQQLFHLHDSGVDQSFIDTLPVFHYKSIIGLKNPFDCAVCLCEFETEDKLRLLPKCSHAFHMECIDTWLLSHSTCPLCRSSLLPELSQDNGCSPIVLVLESGSSREIVPDREAVLGTSNSVARTNSHLGFHRDAELGLFSIDVPHKSCEIREKGNAALAEERVVPVKLGKLKNVEGGEGSIDNGKDARRCFSMGSFEYVMDDNSSLQVPIRTPMKKQSSKKSSLPLTPGHRPAMSECDCESRRKFNGFEASSSEIHGGIVSNGNGNSSAIGRSRSESFSVSKILLRPKKEEHNSVPVDSRRAFSFRFPLHRTVAASAADDFKLRSNDGARRTISEIDFGMWKNGGSQLGRDDDTQSHNSLDSQANPPSFARRTLLWLVGRQNKVVHSSFSPNV